MSTKKLKDLTDKKVKKKTSKKLNNIDNFDEAVQSEVNEPSVALIGDSHAHSLKGALEEVFKLNGASFLQFTKNGCPPSINLISSIEQNCNKFMNSVLDSIENSNITTVILSARWGYYITDKDFDNGMGGIESRETKYSILGTSVDENIDIRREMIISSYATFIEKLKLMNKKIIIVGHIPEHGWSVPDRIAKRYLFTNEIYIESLPLEIYTKRFNKIFNLFETYDDVHIIDTQSIFCERNNSCHSFDNEVGALYFDNNHLSMTGAKLVVEDIAILLFEQTE